MMEESNGHAPGIEFNATSVSIAENQVSFGVTDEDVTRLLAYFAEYSGKPIHVAATVAGDAGSAGDSPETPASGG